MKYWEFLIQKEGDETWLPLETQQVEILEGRYRVVAHTDRVNTPMEIRVSQLITEEMPPRQRVRKRRGETNDAGLVVVMPYVHLKPGQWDLVCSSLSPTGDFIDDVDASWRYQVQLQVFAPTEEDWSSEWPIPTDASGAQSTLIEHSDSLSTTNATQADAPLVQAQAQLKDNMERQGQSPASDTPIDLSYRISLQQQAFLARRNQSMTITGQVQALVDTPQIQGASQLWLRLQNPETAQVIMDAHWPLSRDRLPADFKVKIQLPTNVRTRVVLGEVSLRSASVDGNEPAKILSSTAFTITAGIALLLDDIANKDHGEFEEEISVVFDDTNEAHLSADRSEPSLVSPLLDPTHKAVVPAVGVVLPPKLDRNGSLPVEPAYSTGQPELPAFPSENAAQPLIVSDAPTARKANDSADVTATPPTDVGLEVEELTPSDTMPFAPEGSPSRPTDDVLLSRPSMVSQPAQFMGTSIEDDDLEAAQVAALLEDIDGDLASQAPTIDELEPPGIEGALPESQAPHQQSRSQAQSNATNASSQSADQPRQVADEPPVFLTRAERERQAKQQRQAEANVAFKSLKLKDHFWQRLSNLTHESHKEATQLAQNMRAAGVTPSSPGPDNLSGNSSSGARAFQPDDFSPSSEVVIYDEPQVNIADSAPSSNALPSNAPPSSAPQPNLRPRRASKKRNSRPSQQSAAPTATPSSAPSYSSLAPTDGYRPNYQRNDSESQPLPATSASSGTFSQTGQSIQRNNTELNNPRPNNTRLGETGPEDLPEMALPVISVPVGDLVAGDTVTITVRSQPSVYKPFIKLWMIDRQSRTLVGEAKLLTDLKPDALGYLETSTELRVPMGCLDVQIAAIAVDMATQQESNKAIVNRHVVPSRQSPPPLSSFDL